MAGSFRFEEGQAMKPTVYMEEMDAFTYREKLAKDAVVFIPSARWSSTAPTWPCAWMPR